MNRKKYAFILYTFSDPEIMYCSIISLMVDCCHCHWLRKLRNDGILKITFIKITYSGSECVLFSGKWAQIALLILMLIPGFESVYWCFLFLEPPSRPAGSGPMSPHWADQTCGCVPPGHSQHHWPKDSREGLSQKEAGANGHSQKLVGSSLKDGICSKSTNLIHSMWRNITSGIPAACTFL